MIESVHQDPCGTTPISHLLFRSTEVLNQLPVEFRWEFTRRHPYYLQFWQAARQFREQPSIDPVIRFGQQAASIILNAVNVAPDVPPPDPHDDFETLGMETLRSGWEGGAVAPAILRTLARVLLVALPKAEQAQLGRLLMGSAERACDDEQRIDRIHEQLCNLKGEAWDTFPDIPILSVNLRASQRAITESVETLVRRWKEERNISETRRRNDKLDEYLAVWDRREGWNGGHYDGSSELKFQEISEPLGVPVPTVVNRYCKGGKLLFPVHALEMATAPAMTALPVPAVDSSAGERLAGPTPNWQRRLARPRKPHAKQTE